MNTCKLRKALLLRVGIDRGTGGALSPVFPDGTFEYVPIPERKRTRDRASYATLVGRHGAPLANYLPRKLAQAILTLILISRLRRMVCGAPQTPTA